MVALSGLSRRYYLSTDSADRRPGMPLAYIEASVSPKAEFVEPTIAATELLDYLSVAGLKYATSLVVETRNFIADKNLDHVSLKLCTVLTQMSMLRRLHLDCIGLLFTEKIVPIIRNLRNLEELTIRYCYLGDELGAKLIEALCDLPFLRSLDLSRTCLGPKSFAALSNYVPLHADDAGGLLRELYVSSNDLFRSHRKSSVIPSKNPMSTLNLLEQWQCGCLFVLDVSRNPMNGTVLLGFLRLLTAPVFKRLRCLNLAGVYNSDHLPGYIRNSLLSDTGPIWLNELYVSHSACVTLSDLLDIKKNPLSKVVRQEEASVVAAPIEAVSVSTHGSTTPIILPTAPEVPDLFPSFARFPWLTVLRLDGLPCSNELCTAIGRYIFNCSSPFCGSLSLAGCQLTVEMLHCLFFPLEEGANSGQQIHDICRFSFQNNRRLSVMNVEDWHALMIAVMKTRKQTGSFVRCVIEIPFRPPFLKFVWEKNDLPSKFVWKRFASTGTTANILCARVWTEAKTLCISSLGNDVYAIKCSHTPDCLQENTVEKEFGQLEREARWRCVGSACVVPVECDPGLPHMPQELKSLHIFVKDGVLNVADSRMAGRVFVKPGRYATGRPFGYTVNEMMTSRVGFCMIRKITRVQFGDLRVVFPKDMRIDLVMDYVDFVPKTLPRGPYFEEVLRFAIFYRALHACGAVQGDCRVGNVGIVKGSDGKPYWITTDFDCGLTRTQWKQLDCTRPDGKWEFDFPNGLREVDNKISVPDTWKRWKERDVAQFVALLVGPNTNPPSSSGVLRVRDEDVAKMHACTTMSGVVKVLKEIKKEYDRGS